MTYSWSQTTYFAKTDFPPIRTFGFKNLKLFQNYVFSVIKYALLVEIVSLLSFRIINTNNT